MAKGAQVIIADIDIAAAEVCAAELGAAAHAVHLDVRDEVSIAAMIKATHAHFGPPSILINNAALFTLVTITEITRDDYHKVFSVNVEGLLFTMQAAQRDFCILL